MTNKTTETTLVRLLLLVVKFLLSEKVLVILETDEFDGIFL